MASTILPGQGAVGGSPGAARRSGRRPGPTSTRQGIVRAAQKLFAELGYRGATMRAIAHEANVDAALIHHFFTSKDGLFAAAVVDTFHPDQILSAALEPDPRGQGYQLVRSFLELWDNPQTRDPMLAVIRSSVSYDTAAQLVVDSLVEHVIGHVVKAAGVPQQELRAAMIGSQMMGLVTLRYVICIPPLATLPSDVVAGMAGPFVDRCLSGNLVEDLSPDLAAKLPAITT